MTLSIPDTIVSPQDLTGLILSLHRYASDLQKASIKRRATKHTNGNTLPVPEDVAQFLAAQHISDTANTTTIKECITALESLRKSATVITITLATQPTMDVIRQLTTWCRSNISKNVLVRFEHNRLLLGGMVVRSGSHIYDWSFRRALQNTPTSFSEVLRRV